MGSFSEAGRDLINGAVVGMYLTAREIMAESLLITPIETGTLRKSARIEPVEADGESVRVRFGYGYGDEINPVTRRPAADYAVPVHEILEAKHAPPTQAKFLEQPVLENAQTLAPNMEASIRLVAQRNGTVIAEHVEQLVFPEAAPAPSPSTLLHG